MAYICKRCGYHSPHLCFLKKHLKRKKPCHDDNKCSFTQEQLLEQLENLTFQCLQCNRVFETLRGKAIHLSKCHKLEFKNPLFDD